MEIEEISETKCNEAMNINSIEIVNVKGIQNKKFELTIYPNKPNILVAPNGFGKSSFAIAFESLITNKIKLDNKNYYNDNIEFKPKLTISLTTGKSYIADENQNTIKEEFDVFVINNQTIPKSVINSFNGHTSSKASLDVKTTILIKTIPKKVSFDYSIVKMKSRFGQNSKILNNISKLFDNYIFMNDVEEVLKTKEYTRKSNENKITLLLNQINSQKGNEKEIKDWITENCLSDFKEINDLSKIAEFINKLESADSYEEIDCYLSAWQIIETKKALKMNFSKAVNYLEYLFQKEQITNNLKEINPLLRFEIKPEVEKNKLVVKWPKSHEISNGQRDILTFLAKLHEVRFNFKKRNCILIIDEIFDYLDDANLISFQYYISDFLEKMKKVKKRIFPILLTHLDPSFFKHFCFNESFLNIVYLKESNSKSSKQLLKLIYLRENKSIKSIFDKHYFHYSPENEDVNLEIEFKELKLNSAWSKPSYFTKMILREIRRYLYENTTIDPIAICFGLRHCIERLVYNQLALYEQKDEFLKIHGTKNKLNYATKVGAIFPETYYLLGLIYNTSLHLKNNQDITKPLGMKLENIVIQTMIKNVYSKYSNTFENKIDCL